MRKYLYLFLLLLLALPMAAEHSFTVVLDAGHGGDDPGAIGKFSKEKDLNLKLALKVGELINERYKDTVKVVYTRSKDEFVALQKRAEIANKNKADLFISIHTNAAKKKEACGVETFILGTDKMEQNLDVAIRENAVIKLEEDYNTTYQNFDPNSIDSYIMFELMQNSHMEKSLQFAEMVQKRFVGSLNRDDRGVRQAAFWVLLKTACPSILFEMGFISNAEEEKFLNQPASTAQMANALVNAFDEYYKKQGIKRVNQVAEKQEEKPVEKPAPKVTYYAIQLCASKTPLAPDDARLKGLPCDTIHAGEWIKYYTAKDTDKKKVKAQLPEMKKLVPECWIINFER